MSVFNIRFAKFLKFRQLTYVNLYEQLLACGARGFERSGEKLSQSSQEGHVQEPKENVTSEKVSVQMAEGFWRQRCEGLECLVYLLFLKI